MWVGSNSSTTLIAINFILNLILLKYKITLIKQKLKKKECKLKKKLKKVKNNKVRHRFFVPAIKEHDLNFMWFQQDGAT